MAEPPGEAEALRLCEAALGRSSPHWWASQDARWGDVKLLRLRQLAPDCAALLAVAECSNAGRLRRALLTLSPPPGGGGSWCPCVHTVSAPGDAPPELLYQRALVGLALSLRRALLQAAGLQPAPPGAVLVLGCGGGALPMLLRRHYPQARVVAVELHAEVVAAARELLWYSDGEDGGVRTAVADAAAYCAEQAAAGGPGFDLVLVDCFLGGEMLETELAAAWPALLRSLRRILAPGTGVAAFNAVHNAFGEQSVGELRRYDGPLFTEFGSPQLHMVPVGPCQKAVAAAAEGAPPVGEAAVLSAAEQEGAAGGFAFPLLPADVCLSIGPGEVW